MNKFKLLEERHADFAAAALREQNIDWATAKRLIIESNVMNPNDYKAEDATSFRPNVEGNADGTDVHDNWYLVEMMIALRSASNYEIAKSSTYLSLAYTLIKLCFAQGHETLDTDEPAWMWVSPWAYTKNSAEDFLVMIASFDMETDERIVYWDKTIESKEDFQERLHAQITRIASVVGKDAIERNLADMLGYDEDDDKEGSAFADARRVLETL